MANVEGVACRDKTTYDYRLTLQFSSALSSVLASFSSLFWFSGDFTVLVQSHRSHLPHFQVVVFIGEPHCTLHAQQAATDKVSN